MTLEQIANEAIERIALSCEVEASCGLPTADFDYEQAAVDYVAAKYNVNSVEVQQEIWNIEAANDGPYGSIV